MSPNLLVTIDASKLTNLDKVSYFDLPKMKDRDNNTVKIMFRVVPDSGIGFDVITVKAKYANKELKTKVALEDGTMTFCVNEDVIARVEDDTTDVLVPTYKPELERYFD
jgi:hypothetical protein